MFTDKAQQIIDTAKDVAFSGGSAELSLSALLCTVGSHAEAGVLLAQCMGMAVDKLRAACPERPETVACPGKLPLTEAVRSVLGHARELADEVPDRWHPGLIDLRHVVCALAMFQDTCALLDATPLAREDALAWLAAWYESIDKTPRVEELTERLRMLRTELLARLYGQDHAVHAFVEGLFNAEVVATADTKRKSPRALFVFAGPPGVGKTYLAELGASHLDRPFKRFDMSAYAGHEHSADLIGWAKSYRGAKPGYLTEFVEKNPNAVLLFDEIEKAHRNTIHLFLQLLDAGTLEDKFHERTVNFRDTTVIFTTNAGRKLYDRPNESGVHAANAAFHRRTILDALETETDPQTRQPFFPQAICSRMATGYPVLFNHLRVNELERVVSAELTRVGGLLERQYYKRVTFHDLLPMCMVLREGGRADARTLRSQAEMFVKTELFKFCQLFKTDRLEDVFEQARGVTFTMDDAIGFDADVQSLFEPPDRPRILLVADADLAELYGEHIDAVDWRTAANADDALEILANEEVDLVLLDLWLGRSLETSSMMTMQHFDHVPAAARGLDRGQELLRKIRERLPSIPVYLLSLAGGTDDDQDRGSVDEELFLACVRGGGARGMVVSRFVDGMVADWEKQRDQFAAALVETCRRLHREKAAARLGQERKVLGFDTVPHIDRKTHAITIRLRNLRLSRAVAAADAGEVLGDIERPSAKFADVIGAASAKAELKFFIDYIKNPRRFAALGLKPPKGVLLHGPPGTGKTMLARAMAGESDVAFIPAAASNFVTMWQGSGPQSVRDLFARARRYAPAIIFIDEIDAIGKVRTGSTGGAQSTENTLNALLTEMDGFSSPSADRPVFILAATNFNIKAEDEDSPERSSRTLDPALVRRFARTILVDRPDTAARRQYFAMRLGEKKKVDVSESALDLLAEKSTGMSIANLEQIIETAARAALQQTGGLTDDLLLEALDTAREGEAKEWSPEFLESTARHEAGHTIMYWLSGWWSPEVSIVARADHGGGMRRAEHEMRRESLSREDLLASVRTTLGGRAAEVIYYGYEAGLTTGASGDLAHATQVVRQMICRYGMNEEFGLLATPELFKHAEALGSPTYERVNQAAAAILKEQMAQTLQLLEANRSHLDSVAGGLLAKNRLYRKDLEELLPGNTGKAKQS